MKHSKPLPFLEPVVRNWRSLWVAGTVLTVVAFLGVFFYVRGRSVMESQLRERLRDAAAAAALHFPGEALDAVKGRASRASVPVKRLSERLRSLREALPDIRFAYIMRRTRDPGTLEFVADADIISTSKELDRDGNGRVDPYEVASLPGDPYDIRDIPAMQGPAFQRPTVDDEIVEDQWGALLSGYAPIRRRNGTVAGIIGLDMDAERFQQVSNSIFSPFALLLVLISGGCIASYVLVFLNRRRYELLQRVEDERSALLHLTFHQMGTPLTEFKWALESLKDARGGADLGKAIDEHVAAMEDGIARMDGIVDVLHEADEVHAGTLAYAPQTTSFDAIARTVTDEFKSRLERQGVTLVLDLAADKPVKVDPKLIGGVLRELVGNAVAYTGEGGTVTVRTRCDGQEARVQVIDTGCGIPAEDAARIFGEFVRGSNAATRNPDGVGLGLYIAKGVIEKAGGGMGFSSKEGKGSTFTFWVPVG